MENYPGDFGKQGFLPRQKRFSKIENKKRKHKNWWQVKGNVDRVDKNNIDREND